MSSVVGLEMPNAWRTGQVNDPTFDISADQLNVTTNREMWIPGSTIDWAAVRHTNNAEPIAAQDLATKNYVDINGGSLWSTFPAVQAVDMAAFQINDLADPTLDQDAATKFYVDNNTGANNLNELTDVTITSPQDLQFLRFNSTSSQWENVAFVPGTSNAIEQGNSSVTVIDSGTGRVETVIDGILKLNVTPSTVDIFNPVIMNGQQIRNLATPAIATDAANKDYVDTQILTRPTDLDGLTDVTITSVAVNQVLVNNGSGQWINQILTKSQLPSEIAYEDELNTFTLNNVFTAGLELAPDQNLNLADAFISDAQYVEFSQQTGDPIGTSLDEARIFLDDGASFGSTDPLLEAMINRSGVIVKKPIPTSETIFALKDFSNGMFIDETGTRLSDNNPTIRVQIFQEANEATGNFRAVLDGQIFTIPSPDVSITVANTIDLTEGTDTAPVKHFVILELVLGTPTLTSNTVAFPDTGDFVVIGTFLLPSRVTTIADGGYAINAPDYEIFDDSSRGHLSHINDRILNQDSLYLSGIAITTAPIVGGGTAGNVTYTSTAGKSFELHQEDIESFDITTGIALVENEGTQQPEEVTRVNDIGLDLIGLTCADGVSVIDGVPAQAINVVVYTIHNDDEPNQTNYGINLPITPYEGGARVADAIADVNNFAVKNVPLPLRGITLLIAEIVIDITTATTFEVVAVKDLRGQIPGAAGGSGGGGGGATQLNDLSDVTISTALINQTLVNDGAGQWVNILGPQLLTNNLWTGFQDYTEQTIPANPAASDMRFYVKRIDASNQGLFVKLEQAGVIEEIRVV